MLINYLLMINGLVFIVFSIILFILNTKNIKLKAELKVLKEETATKRRVNNIQLRQLLQHRD